MSELSDIPDEVRVKARIVCQLAQNTDVVAAASILAPWVQSSPDTFVQVMLTLALMGDPDKQLKEAHTAYCRGDRSDEVVALERKYQRERKRRNRVYEKEREGAA